MSRCRLYPPPAPLDETITAALRELPTALLSDQLDRTGGLVGIRPLADLAENDIVVGRALTVRTRPGDNLVIHKAADLAEPGDFLVIDAGGASDRAVTGELWCRYAASRGVVAVAIDGVVRDVAALRRMDMRIFARGFTHVGPYKDGPGELRGPITAGGSVVHAGDYVVGDADGVVTIPADRVRGVVEGARRRLQTEEQMLRDIADGTLDRSWLDSALTVEPVAFAAHGASAPSAEAT